MVDATRSSRPTGIAVLGAGLQNRLEEEGIAVSTAGRGRALENAFVERL